MQRFVLPWDSSKYSASFSRFCTCSGLKFQNIGGVHHPRHLPAHPATRNYPAFTHLWMTFLNCLLTRGKTETIFPGNTNRSIFTTQGCSRWLMVGADNLKGPFCPRQFCDSKVPTSYCHEGGNVMGGGSGGAILYFLHKKPLRGRSIIANCLQEMVPEVQ